MRKFIDTDHISKITGPLLVALFINHGLHGVLSVQVYTCYMAFPLDRIHIKILVYDVFAIESAQTLMVTVDGFDAFVTHMGEASTLDNVRLLWFSVPIVGVLTVGIGQLFFAYRLKVLSKSWIFPITVAILSTCAVVATLVIAIRLHRVGTISAAFTDCFVPALICHLTNIICDIEIAIAMVYYLSRYDTIPSSRLHRQVKRLIRLILEAGILTTTANIVAFLLFITSLGSVNFVIPYVMIPKLYSNTLMFILNNRINVVGGRHNTTPGINTTPWSTDMMSHTGIRSGSGPTGKIVFREARGDDLDDAEAVRLSHKSTG